MGTGGGASFAGGGGAAGDFTTGEAAALLGVDTAGEVREEEEGVAGAGTLPRTNAAQDFGAAFGAAGGVADGVVCSGTTADAGVAACAASGAGAICVDGVGAF